MRVGLYIILSLSCLSRASVLSRMLLYLFLEDDYLPIQPSCECLNDSLPIALNAQAVYVSNSVYSLLKAH